MSEHWSLPAPGMRMAPPAAFAVFTPWADRLRPAAPADDIDPLEDELPAVTVDRAGVALDAFAQGFEEGRRVCELEFATERAAFLRLAAGLEALRPEPPAALAALIAETVGRLARQIVGEAAVDAPLLLERATAIAALVTEEAKPVRLRLRPEDAALLADAALGLDLLPDPTLAPGAMLLEGRDGWIEDGVGTGLDRLRVQLDAMGLPR